MIRSSISIENTRYSQTWFNATIIISSLLGGNYVNAQPLTLNTQPPPSIEYFSQLGTLGSTAVFDLHEPTEEAIVTELIGVYESLLLSQESLDKDLQALIYDNIDDLFA